MAESLAKIQKQIDSLKQKAEQMRKAEVAGVISRIKEAIRHYDLTPRDLGFTGKAVPDKKRVKIRIAVAQFKDPASGKTWSGRGRRPQWFIDALANGKSTEDLRA